MECHPQIWTILSAGPKFSLTLALVHSAVFESQTDSCCCMNYTKVMPNSLRASLRRSFFAKDHPYPSLTARLQQSPTKSDWPAVSPFKSLSLRFSWCIPPFSMDPPPPLLSGEPLIKPTREVCWEWAALGVCWLTLSSYRLLTALLPDFLPDALCLMLITNIRVS